MHARYFGSKLWSGESWYMQIDSHMVFAQNWDSLSISMLNAAPAPKPVLTHYPPAHTSPLKGVGNRICDPLIADSNIEAQIVRLAGAPQYEKTVSKTPHFAPFVAAGYFVAHSSFLAEVPFDPLMPWIFMGKWSGTVDGNSERQSEVCQNSPRILVARFGPAQTTGLCS